VDLLCPLPALALATDQAFTIADPDHASVIRNSNKVQKEAATAPDKSVTVAAQSAPRRFSPHFPPSHQR
jgi:hypothetical protein